MTEKRDEYDSPWKQLLERFFPEFMAFFFPDAHGEIDWEAGYEFLDKELARVVRDATPYSPTYRCLLYVTNAISLAVGDQVADSIRQGLQ